MKQKKIYYYDNELEDEFSGIKRNTIAVDENYQYNHNRLWRIGAWILIGIPSLRTGNMDSSWSTVAPI